MNQLKKNKIKSRKGMTMAEVLVVVAIILILAGVAFIGLLQYQRNMARLERDAIAKEIFIAAQNHLTMSKSENYPGCSVDFLTAGDDTTAEYEEKKKKAAGELESGSDDVYYIMVNSGNVFEDSGKNGNYMLKQMLPVGSIDETVRKGGNFVIRYQPNIAKVMDVFYCSATDSPKKFNYNFKASDYSDTTGGLLTLNNNSTAAKNERKNFRDGKVLGWYGGEGLESLGHMISPPKIRVRNEDSLYVESWYGNLEDYTDNDVSLRLIVEGKQSGAQKYFDIDKNGEGRDPSTYKAGNVVLDDIRVKDKNFAKQFESADEGTFIPGEDLKIRVIAFCATKLANIAESTIKEENSLYAGIADNINEQSISSESTTYNLNGKTVTVESANDNIPDTAYIKNFRHLENLDRKVSNLDANDTSDKLGIRKAIQTENLNWSSFIGTKSVYYSNAADALYNPVNSTSSGKYKPVDPMNMVRGFIYDGKKHSINGVSVDGKGSAGLFGTVSNGTIKNIKLTGFDIKSTDQTAGTLAGSLASTDVTNVVAYGVSSKVPGTNAGGLVGSMSGGKTEYSAAAVQVTGSAAAGGLIGNGSGNLTVRGCYSGGHTDDGIYDKWVSANGHDVNGVTAGGLVGAFSGRIENSYSTCSVSSTSDSGTAGGFAGSVSGSVSNCYCTGLVNGADDGNKGAFVASNNLSGSTGNKYYGAVNEEQELEDDIAEAFDSDTNSLKRFSSNTYDADAYDSFIRNKYPDGYIFKSVSGLSGSGTVFPKGYSKWEDFFIDTHYGDWPSPELFLINTR